MGSSGSAPGCEGCSCGSRLARCTMMMSAVEQWPPPLPPAVSPVLPAGEVEEGLEEQLRSPPLPLPLLLPWWQACRLEPD